MSKQFDPRNYSLALQTPHRLTDMRFWHMHIPFAFALTQMLRPKLFVELGTHKGDSYCAFCQAVDTLGLETRCYGIDTWAGDIHTGRYEDAVFSELQAYHGPRYGGFSTLIRSLFDDALGQFDDGSIDLLHIDGTHTYDSVRHDFEAWLPKMSQQGVVLLHDIAEYRDDFGVWRLWEELKERYPYFEFQFGHGLGVVAVGSEIPEAMHAFFTDERHAPATAHYFSMLGERVAALGESQNLGATPAAEESELVVSPALLPDEAPHTPGPAPRLIAFYLPQFHPIPENDLWWGKGFTEWTNVAQAKPLFSGHYQPRLPSELGFYDLRVPEVRQAQADLAREHGIYGFCYYHYWFKGRRLLDRPLDEMLASGRPAFPFCLCWANHEWTSVWHSQGRRRDCLIAQEYSDEDDRDHIRWLTGVFQDERYIKIDGRPLLLIYQVQALPNPLQTITMWKEEAQRMGVAEPYICKVESFRDFTDPREFGCDAAVEFPPHRLDSSSKRTDDPEEGGRLYHLFEYQERVTQHLERPEPLYRRFPGVLPGWDNTPRYRSGGATILQGSTPELYEHWLKGAIEKSSSMPAEEQIVFIAAWNEWAEGNYLEPDLKYGRAYLEATRRALQASGGEIPASVAVGKQKDEANGAGHGPFSIEEQYRHLLDKYTELQKSLTEGLRAKDQRVLLLQDLQKHYENTLQRYKELRARHGELVKRHKQLVKRHKQLVRRDQRLYTSISAVLDSRQWKIASTLGGVRRRLLPDPRKQAVPDPLAKVAEELSAWREDLDREQDTTDDGND